MIRSSSGGVFIKHITMLYIENYQLSLPENWHQMVKRHDHSLFNFETNAFNEPIIFATGDFGKEVKRPVKAVPTQQVAELKFPWNQKLWNVFITSAFTTNDVCGRLIGPEYSDALDKLLIEIEILMMTNKDRPTEVQTDHIYLTSISDCYHRIKVIETDGQKAKCICIDNGDYEWISLDEIFICKPEFLTVAPQAFKLCLFGLEDFENDPNVAQQQIFDPLVFKSLVGELMSEEGKQIKMILYDTSTEEDVNLNETLMNSILKSIPMPALSQKDNNQVIITSISEDAIYCQLVKSNVYIQQLINNISKRDLQKFRGLYVDKADKKKNYLVYDAKQKNWFRARMERLLDGESHMMYFIDHGYKAMTNVADIYKLDKVSMVLFFYPPQVLKFGLFNVQLTSDIRKRLLALLPSGREALVRSPVTLTMFVLKFSFHHR
jgi:tudor domain-containing protein 1/4/6/7